MTAHGKAGFEASVDAEVDFQHADLCADLRIRSHFQLHQHHAHAVKDPKTVNFSVSVGVFKAACLTDRAGTDIGFVMVSNVNDGQHRLSPMECHAPVPMPAFTPCSSMRGWLRSRGGQYPGVSVCTLPETALLPEMPDGRRDLLP